MFARAAANIEYVSSRVHLDRIFNLSYPNQEGLGNVTAQSVK